MNDQMIQPEPETSRNPRSIAPISCDEVLDLIPALALGAIETGAAHLVRLHCESCPGCAHELSDLERVTRLLPFSAPPRSPSSGAKAALMDRIAAPVPAVAALPLLPSPIVESPAGKRRQASPDSDRSADLLGRTRELVSGKTRRMATAAPIALALVLVSLYSLGGFDFNSNDGEPAPAAQPAVSNVSDSVAAATELQVSFLAAGTGGATVTQPAAVSTGGLGSSFMARSSRSLAQTELMSSVAPKIAECSIKEGTNGSWSVEIKGASLPGQNAPVDVYLIADSGQALKVGKVTLDREGNGVVSFTLDQPMSDFSFLRVGSGESAFSALGDGQHYVFQIDLAARQSQGLGRPD